ncbi:MAG: MFS transporter [Burkholderiales bacterium]|nr:MFS transporter [Burkholderiales bacterium]
MSECPPHASPAPSSDPLPGPERPWILAALMMTMMLAAMDTTIVSTAIPQIVGDLGGFALFGWVFSIYLLAQTVTIPIYGKLADMLGRKPVLMVGMAIFLAGSAASALSWNMPALVVFRGLQGLGAGAILATVYTLAGDLYSVRERAAIEGWLSSMWAVAAIVGPLLGGAFAEYLSWRWIFLVNLPVGAVALLLLARYLHEHAPRQRHRIDYAGATLMLLAGSAVIFALLQSGQAWPWWSEASLAAWSIAVLLVVATVAVERRAAEPIVPGWLWRRRTLACANLSMVGMGIVMMGPSTYLPTYGQSVLGLGPIAAGFVLATMSLGWPTASALSGRLYLRIGFRDTALCGAVLVLAATAGFLALPYPGNVWLVTLDQVVLGAGFGLLSTSMLVGVQSTVTWRDRGVVTGTNVFARYLGGSLGAALCGAIFNGAIARELERAPSALHGQLPQRIDAVVETLQRHEAAGAAAAYLRQAIHAATHQVYVGLAVVAVATLAVVLWTPRTFAPAHEGAAPAANRPPSS